MKLNNIQVSIRERMTIKQELRYWGGSAVKPVHRLKEFGHPRRRTFY